MDAETIGRKAMGIAADICVYTNHNFVTETIECSAAKAAAEAAARGDTKSADSS